MTDRTEVNCYQNLRGHFPSETHSGNATNPHHTSISTELMDAISELELEKQEATSWIMNTRETRLDSSVRIHLDLVPLRDAFHKNFHQGRMDKAVEQFSALYHLADIPLYLQDRLPRLDDPEQIQRTICIGSEVNGKSDNLSIYAVVNFYVMSTINGMNPTDAKSLIFKGEGTISPIKCIDYISVEQNNSLVPLKSFLTKRRSSRDGLEESLSSN